MAEARGDTAIDEPGRIRVDPAATSASTRVAGVAHARRFTGHGSGVLVAEAAIAVLGFAVGAYILLSTLRMFVDCWSAVPYWDQWDNLALDLNTYYWHDIRLSLPQWLFQQHNEHRIAVPRLMFMIDRFLFSMDNKFNLFCNAAIQASLAALLIGMAVRRAGMRITEKVWIAGAVLALLFSAMQWENFLWGFQITYLGVVLAAVASFAALASDRASVATLAAAIALETAAVYSLASGMAVPFLAIPLALWVRRPRWQVAVLSLAALALLASYLYGYETPAYNDDPLRAIGDLRGLATYVLNEVGNPFGLILAQTSLRHPLNWARLFGAAGVLTLIALTIDMAWRGERRGPMPILIAAAMFGLAMMLLTALGRLKFGAALSSRYTSPVLLLWASLIVAATLRLHQRGAPLRIAAKAAALPALLAIAYYQPAFAALGDAWTYPRMEAATALLANVDDPQALLCSYPNPPVAYRRAPLLRQYHLAMFAEEWSDWLGTPLSNHARVTDSAKCRGGIDGIEPVGASDPKGWRVKGSAWDPQHGTVPRHIVITNASGIIIGYGLTGFPSAGSEARSGWRGHFGEDTPPSAAAYALLENGQLACPLRQLP